MAGIDKLGGGLSYKSTPPSGAIQRRRAAPAVEGPALKPPTHVIPENPSGETQKGPEHFKPALERGEEERRGSYIFPEGHHRLRTSPTGEVSVLGYGGPIYNPQEAAPTIMQGEMEGGGPPHVRRRKPGRAL